MEFWILEEPYTYEYIKLWVWILYFYLLELEVNYFKPFGFVFFTLPISQMREGSTSPALFFYSSPSFIDILNLNSKLRLFGKLHNNSLNKHWITSLKFWRCTRWFKSHIWHCKIYIILCIVLFCKRNMYKLLVSR